MGEKSRTSKLTCMGIGVGVDRVMRGHLGDMLSKEMGMNKGGDRESKFMSMYVQWVKRVCKDNKLGNFD